MKLTPENRAAVYREIFEVDKRGAAILEDLVLLFSKGAKVEGGIDAVLATYHRLGEHAVVQHIINQINRANSVPEPLNDDERTEQ